MTERSPIQTAALLVGVVFLLVGILGFIPGITSNYDDLKFVGHDSDAQLLGIFDTSILHNIVHLLFGVAGIALARTYDGARNFLIGGGVIYLALFLYGVIFGADEGGANWIPVNWADNILHLALGAGMIVTGLALAREVRERRTAPAV
ncbi:MAG: DUF4383 domain-containing protein [Gaiellaceae bacterium]